MTYDYAIHILTIKLWEWEAVIENARMMVHKSGPEQPTDEFFFIADDRIKELKSAILNLQSTKS